MAELQRTDGSWTLDSELASCLNVVFTALRDGMPKAWDAKTSKGPVSETAWATALVLAYFENFLASRSDEWILLARKAKAWLTQQAQTGTDDSNNAKKNALTLIAEATKILQSNQS
ncbi:unnamed protein product [Echinostoma caproni]|uniref:Uncharacterized protein n=1 Tax=Echinostoma caproni TaxID=27848 RepID=A0A3P8H1E7_9TREM|nr:unnamed protein product [Echinostoma caproni]